MVADHLHNMPRSESELAIQIKQTLAKSPLSELPADTIEQLLADAQRVDVPRNANLYNPDEDPRCALIISGVIRIFMLSPDGRQVTVRYARSAELVGLAANTFGTLRQRIARHLLDLAASSLPATTLVANISQQELADAVGSVRPVVARILRDLRDAGFVETTKDGITLLDPQALVAETWAESV